MNTKPSVFHKIGNNDVILSKITLLCLNLQDVYWPKQDDGNLNLGPFEIKHEKLVRKKHYVMMELSLTSNHVSSENPIVHFGNFQWSLNIHFWQK